MLNDRMVIDNDSDEPVGDISEGDRIADLMGDKSIMIMGSHGVTVVGPTVHDAFDELFSAERTTMYQFTAMSSGQPLRKLPEAAAAARFRAAQRTCGCADASRRLAPHSRQAGARLRELRGRKEGFFLEKKKQKTFIHWRPAKPR